MLARVPSLAGDGCVGSPVTVDPGSWHGTPAPRLALQWRRDGASIAGATEPSYTPVPADDRVDLTCAVTATNSAGTAEAVTTPLRVTRISPTGVGGSPDSLNSGVDTLNDFPDFIGSMLSLVITGDGVSIDPASGEIRVLSEMLQSGVTIAVTARNADGTSREILPADGGSRRHSPPCRRR